MANKHIVREREAAGGAENQERQGGYRGQIVSEVMGDIIPWRKRRDGDFEALWDEYYAKWRGFWSAQHKSFKTERSKLISPLTSMAIDLSVAEIIEAIFGREYFIDLPDDVEDQDTKDMDVTRRLLVQDLKNVAFVDEMAQTALTGSLYGTGIMKIQVTTKVTKKPYRTKDGEVIAAKQEVVIIKPISIEPGAFVADPGCRDIDDMKGCAHEFQLPLHLIARRQQEGFYFRDVTVGKWGKPILSPNRGDTDEGNRKDAGDVAFITEYYGLVSTRSYLQAVAEGKGQRLADELVDAIASDEMTEVIATIANETHLLRLVETPLVTGERLVAAYQHETVPNRFYGRGVAEKGASVQRAMDAEMRARIDALAWSNNPMFAGDLTRLPPGSSKNAWPGKFWGVRGNPSEVLQEFKLTGPDANSYQHMQDLERMGQQATGALDTNSMRQGMRDETATGSALAASGFIKRSKRTMYNIEEFLNRVVRRVATLKMQFEPQRYPQDYEFQVRGSMGIMAREIEQQFLVNLAQVLGPDHQASMPIIKAIFEHSGSPVKSDVLESLRASEEESKPTPEMQQLQKAAQMAQMQAPILQVEKLKAEIEKILSEAGLKEAQMEKVEEETELLDESQDVEEIRVLNDLKETANQQRQMDILEDKNQIERDKLKLQSSKGKT
jgi:hypothetical protein